MYGSMIGDMVGADYEFVGIKTTDFSFQLSYFTDDTVMTIAVAHGLMKNKNERDINLIKENLICSMQYFGQKYDNVGYGSAFFSWLFKRNPSPYNSFGNGAAMRVGSIAYLYPDDLERALEVAKISAEISHNHPEGIKGAVATVELIWLANAGADKDELKKAALKYYNLNKTCDEIRKDYKFDVTCQGTVPVAIECFLEGNNYEESVRLAISMGGDSDTLACICGSIAEAYFGVPEYLKKECRKCLLDHGGAGLLDVVNQFEKYIRQLEKGVIIEGKDIKQTNRRKAHTMEIRDIKEFQDIKSGNMKHHIRLYDDKRKRISPGDYITFQLAGTEEKCIVRVRAVYITSMNELLKKKELLLEKEKLEKDYTLDELCNGTGILFSFC